MCVGSVGRVDVCFLFWGGGLSEDVAELPPPFTPLFLPSQRTNKWSCDREMTKRCTECTGQEGSGIALQMRWGNVAVVHWAAE